MASPKPKRKPKPRKDASKKPQPERFKETARELGVDETGERFDDAFVKISPPKKHSASEMLTDSERQSLRQGAKEDAVYFQKAFAHLRPTA